MGNYFLKKKPDYIPGKKKEAEAPKDETPAPKKASKKKKTTKQSQ